MKIYFAASISAGRDDQPVYELMVAELARYGTVLTELIGSVNLTADGEALSDRAIHDRDVDWLLASDCVVAEVTTPSLGVGYEIARALAAGIAVLCFHRPASGRRLSAMIAGAPGVKVVEYDTFAEVREPLADFMAATCYDG
jgi:hypothetical protein